MTARSNDHVREPTPSTVPAGRLTQTARPASGRHTYSRSWSSASWLAMEGGNPSPGTSATLVPRPLGADDGGVAVRTERGGSRLVAANARA